MGKTLSVNKNPGKKDITGGLSIAQLGDEIRDLKTRVPVMIPVASIPKMPEFENLFPIKEGNLESISDSIRVNGFDGKFAVIIGTFPDGTRSLVAGFTRTKAAGINGLSEIPAWTQGFPSVDAALDWAIHEQLDRRNLTESEIYEYVKKIDQITGKGRQSDGFKGKSSQRTANIVGVSARKVEQIRTVEKDGSDQQKEAIRTGQKSVNQAYREIKDQKNEKAQHCANSSPPERKWSVEIGKSDIRLVQGEEIISLVNCSAMDLMYNGAPYKAIRKAVEEYMEKVLG
ncbi:MAG: hypothetical protein PQJ58_15100 [Spirochaetales bacterium]|nr:hypothetical protein [Spirochaetales bacterium]